MSGGGKIVLDAPTLLARAGITASHLYFEPTSEMYKLDRWKVDRSDTDGLGMVFIHFPRGDNKTRYLVGPGGRVVDALAPRNRPLQERVGMDFSRFIRRGEEM